MNNSYTEISFNNINDHFSQDLISSITSELVDKIMRGESNNLERGQGIFFFNNIPTTEGPVNIAVNTAWVCSIESNQFKLIMRKWYLYIGDFPDKILDEANEMALNRTNVEWKNYE